MRRFFNRTKKPRYPQFVAGPYARGMIAGYSWAGGMVKDITGRNHNGTLQGGSFVTSKYGDAWSGGLDNATDYVEITDHADFHGMYGLTIICRVKNNKTAISATGTEFLVSKRGVGADSFVLDWLQSEDVNWDLDTAGSGTAVNITDGIPPGSGNTWCTVCARYDGVTLFLDTIGVWGHLSNTAAHSTGGTVQDSSHNIFIGNDSEGSTGSWDGLIDYVYIYNRCISNAEMFALDVNPNLVYPQLARYFPDTVVGTSDADFNIAATGLATWNGQSFVESDVSIASAGLAVWNQNTLASSDLSVTSVSSVTWNGLAAIQADLSIGGTATLVWDSGSLASADLSVQATGLQQWVGQAIADAGLQVLGQASLVWNGSSLAVSDLDVNSIATVTWVGTSLAGGDGDVDIQSTSLAVFNAQSIIVADANMTAAALAEWVGAGSAVVVTPTPSSSEGGAGGWPYGRKKKLDDDEIMEIIQMALPQILEFINKRRLH